MGSPRSDFADFYRSSKDECLRTVLGCVGDLDTAQDLVDEAFARACASWLKVSRHPAPAAWVVRTALNVNISRWRRRRREVAVADFATVADLPAGFEASDSPVDPAIMAALLRLPAGNGRSLPCGLHVGRRVVRPGRAARDRRWPRRRGRAAADAPFAPGASRAERRARPCGSAARAVAPLRCPVPRPGQYIVVTSVNWWMTEDDPGSRHQLAWLTLDRRRVWQSADGRKPEGAWIDYLRIRRLPWSRPAPATGLGASWSSLPAQRRPGAPPVRGTYEFLTTLPTNPVTLRAWIYGHLDGGQPPDDQAWTDITDLLGGMLVPPRLAAALFKVAATIPGATVKPHVIDAAGRAGIAVARVGQEYPEDNELIFDPRTYRLLGQRSTLAAPEKGLGPAGTVTLSSAQLSETVASHLPRFLHGYRVAPSVPSPAC